MVEGENIKERPIENECIMIDGNKYHVSLEVNNLIRKLVKERDHYKKRLIKVIRIFLEDEIYYSDYLQSLN